MAKRKKKQSWIQCPKCKHFYRGKAPVGSVEHKLQALEEAIVLRDQMSKAQGRDVYISPFDLRINPVGARSVLLEEAVDIVHDILDGQPLSDVADMHGVTESMIRRLLAPVVPLIATWVGDKPLSAASRRPAPCGHGTGPCINKACYVERFTKQFGVPPAHCLD